MGCIGDQKILLPKIYRSDPVANSSLWPRCCRCPVRAEPRELPTWWSANMAYSGDLTPLAQSNHPQSAMTRLVGANLLALAIH